MKRLLFLPLFFYALLGTSRAHHGLDYMVLQDGQAPGLLSIMPFTAADFSRGDYGDEFNIESGFLLGLGHDIGLGASVGFSDEEGGDWRYSAVTPYITVPLFRSDAVPWLRIGLYAGYQFADEPEAAYREVVVYETPKKAASTTASTASAASISTSSKGAGSAAVSKVKKTRHTGGGGGGGGPDAPPGGGGAHDHPVAAPAAAAPQQQQQVQVTEPVPVIKQVPVDPYEGATGIHRHGEEGMVARLIATVDLGAKDQVVMNFINFTPREGNVGWGYAVGYRHSFHHDLAVSLEAIGDFDSTADHEVLAGVHWSPLHHLVLKLGAGVGVGEESSEFSIHTGVVLRF